MAYMTDIEELQRRVEQYFQCGQRNEPGGRIILDLMRALREERKLREVLKEITDHFASVMGGPLIMGRGITFENGVEGIPTIKAARDALKEGDANG
jgi:hypothetical protein